jgi:hypothetical protein
MRMTVRWGTATGGCPESGFTLQPERGNRSGRTTASVAIVQRERTDVCGAGAEKFSVVETNERETTATTCDDVKPGRSNRVAG